MNTDKLWFVFIPDGLQPGWVVLETLHGRKAVEVIEIEGSTALARGPFGHGYLVVNNEQGAYLAPCDF